MVRLSLLCAATAMTGCATVHKMEFLAVDPIDPASPVAAEVKTAEQSPGPYPKFSKLPPMPTDLRPDGAWRVAVVGEWAVKRQVERDAAAIPFTLNDSEAWAEAQRARVSTVLSQPAPADAKVDAEAFAAAERARATPPPSSK